jgi:hypothetical protein
VGRKSDSPRLVTGGCHGFLDGGRTRDLKSHNLAL